MTGCLLSCSLAAQGLDALKKDYPLLMEKFGGELDSQRADYYFLVDVSGTMQQYRDVVVPALQEFFRSLQTDDYVSVIKFGGKARNDLSSFGSVRPEMIQNLIRYVPNLYQMIQNAEDQRLFSGYTDLEAMLLYLTDELHQAGRNNLKFIFVITDFIHDPLPGKRGHEQWDAIAVRLQNEQSENHVCAFALQLPGEKSGRDLEQVRRVFPPAFGFELQEVQNRTALSEWFTDKKNRILLDKFTVLIGNKLGEAGLSMEPELTVDGHLRLNTSRKANELFDGLSLDSLSWQSTGFRIDSRLPAVIRETDGRVYAGQIRYQSVAFPFFHAFRDTLTVQASPASPWMNELRRLGVVPETLSYPVPLRRTVFTFYLPLWLTVVLLGALLLYLLLVCRAFGRNRAAANKINGRFVVRYEGEEIARKEARARQSVDIGMGASFISVAQEACNWRVEIRYVTYACFRCFKKPEYRIYLLKGARFKTDREYLNHQHPPFSRGRGLFIGSFSIKWNF
ncbi:MAG: VWA domain-containing protein [Tannerella sp.]|nr:VWA domain-containing protein [Tannerella sp.]